MLSAVMTVSGRPAGSALTTTTGTGEATSQSQLASDSWLDAMISPSTRRSTIRSR
jgi:hypothetical protein